MPAPSSADSPPDTLPLPPTQILSRLQQWSDALGFRGLAVSRVNLADDKARLAQWLEQGRHGEMAYMARHRGMRCDPAQLHPGTLSVICVRMPYLPAARPAREVLADPELAYISRYALGRDYHKVVRGRLRRLARQLGALIGPFGYRAFADSAPMLEKALARDASLGWFGKHSVLIDPDMGSWFFLGELLTDLPLPASNAPAVADRCGSCQACLRACPTDAILPGRQIDARRCISYLTIEHKGSIPETLRPAIGNRIFGCDDCQLVCPWNRGQDGSNTDPEFSVRHGLDQARLTDLFAWDEATFLKRTEGMPIRRTGYRGWLRNLAVALGNAPGTPDVIQALQARADHADDMVREHVQWALAQHDCGDLLPE